MTTMTPDEENAFYADPDNQVPQGAPVRRKAKLSEPVPVRFPEELLREVRQHAAADDRSVRRKAKLSEPVPVRFPEELLREVRQHAAADDRSVSNWIRRAVEHELDRTRG